MADFPTIAPPTYSTSGSVVRSQVRTEMESGYAQTRARGTRGFRRWALHWANLSNADYALLEAHFLPNSGNSFSWVEPVTGTAYTVRYVENSLEWSHSNPGYRTVSIGLEEV